MLGNATKVVDYEGVYIVGWIGLGFFESFYSGIGLLLAS